MLPQTHHLTLNVSLIRFALLLFSALGGICFASIVVGCNPTIPHAADQPVPPATHQGVSYEAGTTKATVVLAGGCFWCTEAAFEQVDGVTDVVSGYAGGTKETANYTDVSRGRSTHAEAIQVTFDPTKISYEKILQIFFTMHDPTQLNQQFPDTGKQYRSAIFFANESEKNSAQTYIQQVDASKYFTKPIATTLEPLDIFYPAEDYHQDYAVKNPTNDYVITYSLPKIPKVRKLFPQETSAAQGIDSKQPTPGAAIGSGTQQGSGTKPQGSGSKPQGSGSKPLGSGRR